MCKYCKHKHFKYEFILSKVFALCIYIVFPLDSGNEVSALLTTRPVGRSQKFIQLVCYFNKLFENCDVMFILNTPRIE